MDAQADSGGRPPRRAKGRGRRVGVALGLLVLVILGAAIAVWWFITMLDGPRQEDVVGVIDGYFGAAARNDRETAQRYIYNAPDAVELGADDFSGPFEPEVFFAYRGILASHYFAADRDAYLYGLVEYSERPSRRITAVVRRDDEGNWGLLRLWLSEPLSGET